MKQPHAHRMAMLVALMVVLLVAVAINQFRTSVPEQQAAVLRAYSN